MEFKFLLTDDNTEIVIQTPNRCTYETWKKSKQSWMTRDYSKVKQCTVDFSRTTFIDSSGVGALLILRELLVGETTIIFINMSDDVRNVLDIVKLSKIVTFI